MLVLGWRVEPFAEFVGEDDLDHTSHVPLKEIRIFASSMPSSEEGSGYRPAAARSKYAPLYVDIGERGDAREVLTRPRAEAAAPNQKEGRGPGIAVRTLVPFRE